MAQKIVCDLCGEETISREAIEINRTINNVDIKIVIMTEQDLCKNCIKQVLLNIKNS